MVARIEWINISVFSLLGSAVKYVGFDLPLWSRGAAPRYFWAIC